MKRAIALGDHIGDGFRDFLMRVAGDKLFPRGIDSAVENAHRAVFIPGDIFKKK